MQGVMQWSKRKVHWLTVGIPEGLLVSSIIVVYSGFKWRVTIPQQ